MLIRCVLFMAMAALGGALLSSCPKKEGDCMQGTIPSPSDNVDLLCTTILSKTLRAINCYKKCRFAIPQSLMNTWKIINSTCTGKPGCMDISADFLKLDQCLDTKAVASLVVKGFNNNVFPSDTACQLLRAGRNCQYLAAEGCPFLETIMMQQQEETPRYRAAISICGSENLPKSPIKSLCTEDIFTSIQQKCLAACAISVADSSESLCQALQQQSDCLVEESGTCFGSLETYLLPRLDSYAMANQFLKCNINVDGIVVKPASSAGRENCDYRNVLKSCFMMDTLDSIHYIFVKNLLNFDFPIDNFCRNDFDASAQMDKCASALWSCSLPIATTFKTPSKYDGSYYPALGTFPVNRWGLQTIIDSCSTWLMKPTILCRGSTMAPIRPTMGFIKRRTQQPILRRPTPSRKPILL